MLKLLMKLKRDERGISALEYAVLAAILIVAIVAGLEMLDVTSLFQGAADAIGSATDAAADAGGEG